MSEDRHIPLVSAPHRSDPPSENEIFGEKKKLTDIELGLLQMQILWLLNRKSTHGYEIMGILNSIKSTKIGQGTLYPTLKKLRKNGFVTREKTGDKFIYHITPEGKKVLVETGKDFTRTFFGIFQDFVCHKCLGDHSHKL